jgi:Fe2+ or Zn2+ uptake regulation protein
MGSRRNSLQKRIIGEALMEMDHPTAAEVYERVRQDCPQISLGTVYRNLGTMADEGTALRLSFLGEPDRFDPTTQEHFHVVCSSCGRIFDTEPHIVPTFLGRLDQEVERSTGVEVREHTLLLRGICAACRDESAFAEKPERRSGRALQEPDQARTTKAQARRDGTEGSRLQARRDGTEGSRLQARRDGTEDSRLQARRGAAGGKA